MVLRFEAIWYTDLSELRKQRDSSVEKCTHLSDKLQNLNAELEKKNKKLIGLRREFIGVEGRIKDVESDIFHVSRKRTEIDETAYSFLAEIKSKETELAELNNEKQVLETEIDAMQNNLQKISKELIFIDTQEKQDAQQVDRLLEEKFKITEEISDYLSNTSLEREQVQEKFDDLNRSFIQNMEEREAVKRQLDDLKTTVKGINETVDGLKQQFASLEEVKALQTEMISLQTEVAESEQEFFAIDSKLKERQTELTEKREQLDLLLAENSEQKQKTETFEKDVKVYREALSEYAAAQENFDTSKEDLKQGSDAIEKVLTEKNYLEKDLQANWKQIDTLEQIATDLTP